MLQKRTLYTAILALGSLVVAGVIGEVAARLLFPAPLRWLQPQVLYTASPTLGFRMVPNQSAFTADRPLRTNSYGLRGIERSWQKAPGVKRIVLLGDSIAFGHGVADEDTFAQQLENRLNRSPTSQTWEVINTGVGAYNTTLEVTYFEREGIRFDPDLVILGFYWNDIHDKLNVSVDPLGRLYNPSANPSKSRWKKWLTSPQMYEFRNLIKQSRLIYTVVERLRQLKGLMSTGNRFRQTQMAILHGQPHARVEKGWKEVERQIVYLAELCRSHRVPLLIAILPMPEQLARSYPKIQYQTVMQSICDRYELWCLDLLPAFEAAYEGHTSLFISYDGDHPNKKGHALIAHELSRAIEVDH